MTKGANGVYIFRAVRDLLGKLGQPFMASDQTDASPPKSRFRRTSPVLRVFAIPGFGRLLASQALFDIGAVARTAAQSWVM